MCTVASTLYSLAAHETLSSWATVCVLLLQTFSGNEGQLALEPTTRGLRITSRRTTYLRELFARTTIPTTTILTTTIPTTTIPTTTIPTTTIPTTTIPTTIELSSLDYSSASWSAAEAPTPAYRPSTEGPTPLQRSLVGSSTRASSVDGSWGDWSYTSQCSVSCGQGTRSKVRRCNNPTPSNGGRLCTLDWDPAGRGGLHVETLEERCEQPPCPESISAYWSTTRALTQPHRPPTATTAQNRIPATSAVSVYSHSRSAYWSTTRALTQPYRPPTETPTPQNWLPARTAALGDPPMCGDRMEGSGASGKRYSLGTVINASCSPGEPLVTWGCQRTPESGATWIAEREYTCTGIEELQQIAKLNLTNENVRSVLESVANVTYAAGRQFGVAVVDVQAASQVLTKAISLVLIQNQRDNLLEVLNMSSTIVSQLLMAPTTSVTMSSTANSVSHNVELLLWAATETLEANSTVSFVKDNVAVQVTSDPEVIGIEVYGDDEPLGSKVKPVKASSSQIGVQSEALIFFSGDIKDARKSFAVYHNSKLFQGNNMHPVSKQIISAQILRNISHDELITMHFQLFTDTNTDVSNATCGFWSYADNDWSTFGCITKTPILSRVVCSCNHTTHLAALMSTSKPSATKEEHRIALTVMTRVGLFLSIALLLVVVVSYLLFRNLREGMTQKVLFHLSLSILLLNATFLVGIDRVESRAVCTAFAATLHLFVLSSFAWMSVEALLEYLRFTTFPVAVPEKYHIYAAFPAWGLPAIVVTTLLAIDTSFYDSTDEGICWVKQDVLHFCVFLPIALSIAFNGIMFALIARVLIKIIHVPMNTNQPMRKRQMNSLKGCISVFFLMGLTWVFGYLAIVDVGLVFQYLFCIFNPAQGAVIAIFHSRAMRLLCGKLRRVVSKKQKEEPLVGATRCSSNSTAALTSHTNQATSQM